jgi:hypothetical protein
MSKKTIASNIECLCKIFIKKKLILQPRVAILENSNDLFNQLNRDLYSAVRNHNKIDYFYSQSYWDRYDKTLLFTDSYWLDYRSCSSWLNSKTRQDIIDKYSEYFKVETTYNILIDKMAEDIPLL